MNLKFRKRETDFWLFANLYSQIMFVMLIFLISLLSEQHNVFFCLLQLGELGSGAGKGGGGGGAVREAGGAFGRREAAEEERYFR